MGEALRFLVIDDDAVDRQAVKRALAAARLLGELFEADGAEAGLGAIAERDFDCVLLDFHMPGKNGMDVLVAIRHGERNRATPIILLTGHGDEQTAVVFMKAGATDYLAKAALTAERLEQSVRYALRVHRAEQEAQEAQRSLARYTAQLQGLAAASTEVSARLDMLTVLRSFAVRANQLLAGRRAGVAIIHPENPDQVLHASSQADEPERTFRRHPLRR